MNENQQNIDVLRLKIQNLENENEKLRKDNKILGDELTYFKGYCEDLESEVNLKSRMLKGVKLNNGKLTIERNNLVDELTRIKNMSMFEFGNTYCTAESLESDGHAFARSLLGKPATAADIAEETAIANGEKHYAIFNGDDF